MAPQHRLWLLLAATFVSIAVAQQGLPSQITAAPAPVPSTARSYPPCAEICLAAATGSLQCPEEDSSCLCAHQKDVRTSVEGCLAASNACSADETTAAASYYENVCRALGLDENGQPSMIIASGSIATATNVAGLVPVPAASPIQSSSGASATSTITSSEQNETNAKASNDDEGLSIATVAGIAVGCTFIVIAIISGLIWMYIRRREEEDEIEAQPQKPKGAFEGSTPSFKTPNHKASEKTAEYALSCLASQSPPKYTRSNKPTIAERRNNSAQPLHHNTPSATLNNSSYPFPFGDKSAAEASMTSLALPNSASKPVSAIIVQKSPARSQFSDQASIYSVSSIHSEDVQVERASEARLSRPTTFYNLYSNGAQGQSNTNLLPNQQLHPTSGISKGQGSLRRNKFDPQVDPPLPINSTTQPHEHDSSSPFKTPPTTEASQNPFASPTHEARNPFASGNSPPVERPNPLRSHPSQKGRTPAGHRSLVKSGNSFGKFDFEIDAENRKSSGKRASQRNSFFGALDVGFGHFEGGKGKK